MTRTNETLNTATDANKSGELSTIVENALKPGVKIEVNVVNNSDEALFDDFPSAKFDIGDLDGSDNAFAAGKIGHALEERLQADDYSVKENRENADNYNKGHDAGLIAEGKIVTSMLGIPNSPRKDVEIDYVPDAESYKGVAKLKEENYGFHRVSIYY